jgi:hypothetical protein
MDMAVTQQLGAPSPSTDLEDQFRDLVVAWKTGRGPRSLTADLVRHPAYQAIIALGPPAVPLLLRELEREPDLWFAALRAITGANPVLVENQGRLSEMASAWLAWGREQGLHW